MYKEPAKYPTGIKDITGREIRRYDYIKKISGRKEPETGFVRQIDGEYIVHYFSRRPEKLGNKNTKKKWQIVSSVDWTPAEKLRLNWLLTTEEGSKYMDEIVEDL